MEKEIKSNKRKEHTMSSSSANDSDYQGDSFSMSSSSNDAVNDKNVKDDEFNKMVIVNSNRVPISGHVNSLLVDCIKQSSANNTLKLVDW